MSGGLLTPWLRKFDAGEFGPPADLQRHFVEELECRIGELERMVGRLTIENDRLRSALVSNDNDRATGAASGPKRTGPDRH